MKMNYVKPKIRKNVSICIESLWRIFVGGKSFALNESNLY